MSVPDFLDFQPATLLPDPTIAEPVALLATPEPLWSHTTVRTPLGNITGKRRGGIEEFLGIPYASQRRFSSPVDATHYAHGVNATAWGPQCPYLRDHDPEKPAEWIGSEDCLSLNVWRPENAANASVLLFLPGGGFLMSDAHAFNLSVVAADTRSIVVSAQYRVGALGFMAMPSRGGRTASANWGLLDQRSAMRWVKKAIHSFGGDPSRVTLWGHSAGGASVLAHMVMPESQPLFERGIVQSAFASSHSMRRASRMAAPIINRTGCAAHAAAPPVWARHRHMSAARAASAVSLAAEVQLASTGAWGRLRALQRSAAAAEQTTEEAWAARAAARAEAVAADAADAADAAAPGVRQPQVTFSVAAGSRHDMTAPPGGSDAPQEQLDAAAASLHAAVVSRLEREAVTSTTVFSSKAEKSVAEVAEAAARLAAERVAAEIVTAAGKAAADNAAAQIALAAEKAAAEKAAAERASEQKAAAERAAVAKAAAAREEAAEAEERAKAEAETKEVAAAAERAAEEERLAAAARAASHEAAKGVVKCLQQLPLEELLGAVGGAGHPMYNWFEAQPWAPVVDGVSLRGAPMALWRAAPPTKPLLLGTNANEGHWNVYGQHREKLDADGYVAAVNRSLFTWYLEDASPALLNRTLERYPPERANKEFVSFGLQSVAYDHRERLSELTTGFSWACGTQLMADLAAKNASVFLYRFAQAPLCASTYNSFAFPGRAPHMAELDYVLGLPIDFNLTTSSPKSDAGAPVKAEAECALTGSHAALGARMRRAIGAFAASGDPSTPGVAKQMATFASQVAQFYRNVSAANIRLAEYYRNVSRQYAFATHRGFGASSLHAHAQPPPSLAQQAKPPPAKPASKLGEAIAGAAEAATDEEPPIVIDEAAYHEWKPYRGGGYQSPEVTYWGTGASWNSAQCDFWHEVLPVHAAMFAARA